MDKVSLYIVVMIISVFISSCSQIMLKKSAIKKHDNFIGEYINIYVIVGYGVFVLSTFLTIFSLKYLPISMVPIIESMGYIFILILSRVFLDEKISKSKIWGMILISVGIVIFNV